MDELSLYVLDIAMNSVRAGATEILIELDDDGEWITFTVTDNGCGMTASQMGKIFCPFVTYKPGGTGLGLAVTRQIIEAHHGTLTVTSTPGKGSCFTVFLPEP